MVGAILTQQTAWKNVEEAIRALSSGGLMEPHSLARADIRGIEERIRGCGFYKQKARYLKGIAQHLAERYQGSVSRMLQGTLEEKRAELLSLPGVGMETADSILLYCAGYPVFVIDAYTRRLCERLGIPHGKGYADIQRYFQSRLRCDPGMYKEFHALIVALGKHHCRAVPRCEECPLWRLCPRKGLD